MGKFSERPLVCLREEALSVAAVRVGLGGTATSFCVPSEISGTVIGSIDIGLDLVAMWKRITDPESSPRMTGSDQTPCGVVDIGFKKRRAPFMRKVGRAGL